MDHFDIDLSLTEDQRQYFIDFHHSNKEDYYKHTVGEDYTNLDMLFFSLDPVVEEVFSMFALRPARASLMHVAPNAVIVPHVDGTEYQRLTAVVFPLAPTAQNFAPTILYKDENESHLHFDCYAFSTQVTHGVRNNEHDRLALQLWYPQPIEALETLHSIGRFLVSD